MITMARPAPRGAARAVWALLRPSKRSKNAFVIAPVLFAQRFGDTSAVLDVVAATVIFCLVASAVYVDNDWTYSREFIDVTLAALAASVIAFYSLFTISDYAIERYHTQYLYLTTLFVAAGILRYLQVVFALDHYGTPTDIALTDRFMQVVVGSWLLSFIILYAL
jgi:hypothetical protein